MAKRRLLATVTVGILVIIVSAITGHRLPLYDGVSAPDEAYRYVKPSPSLKATSPPTAAEITFATKDAQNSYYISIGSNEVGPQVALFMYASVLQFPQSATKITVRMVPQVSNNDQPSDGTIVGNVYHFSAISNANKASGNVTFTASSNNPAQIDLRLPQGYAPGAMVEYRQTPGGPWTSFITNQVGNDIYEAPVIGFGDYALAVSKTSHFVKHSSKGRIVLIVIIATLLIVIGAIVGLIRFKATQGKQNAVKKPRHKT